MRARLQFWQTYFMLIWSLMHEGDGYNCPYGQKCKKFQPAPPGHTPPCAKPGLTYCLDVEPYPAEIIRQLIDAGRFNVHSLISDESRDDFNENKKPSHPYGYGPNSLPNVDQISIVNQPFDYNSKFHTKYNHDIFSHKTPLQPPSPIDPSPYNVNTHHNSNRTNFGFHGYTSPNFWNTPNQYDGYDQKIYRHNTLPPNFSIYNQFFDQNLVPNNGWPPNQFESSSSHGVTQYNPNEWWKYIVNEGAPDVTVQRSITFPTRSAAARMKRKRRNTKLRNDAATETVNNAAALRIALELANAETIEEANRSRRQAPGTEQLCSSRTEFITPRAALNNRGNWRYVVNMPDNMTQLVRVELCRSTVCNGVCSLPIGYTSRCEQKYVQKRLMALDDNGDSLYNDVFWFPSCCQCTIMSDDL